MCGAPRDRASSSPSSSEVSFSWERQINTPGRLKLRIRGFIGHKSSKKTEIQFSGRRRLKRV